MKIGILLSNIILLLSEWLVITCMVFCCHFQVNFPNLEFSSDEIDFGCILNDTEVLRFIDITNNNPMPVSYRWSFIVKEGEENIK